MEFTCECCIYNTTFKSNYTKHLSSTKHILRSSKKVNPIVAPVVCDKSKVSTSQPKDIPDTPKNTPEPPEVTPATGIFCKYCNQSFHFKQSMYRHIKYSCKKNKDEDLKELVRLLNLRLETERKERLNERKERLNERKELQAQLDTQAKQIGKLMGKLEINGSFNNNTINNITLLAYRDTDVSHLTPEDYMGFYKKVNHCVKLLIEKIHFNPEKPENMNIYISNMKDKYMTIYDGKHWNLANKNIEMARLYEEKEQMLEDWLESNPDPLLKEKFARYLSNKESDDCFQYIMEDIKLMMYNKTRSLDGLDGLGRLGRLGSVDGLGRQDRLGSVDGLGRQDRLGSAPVSS